MSFDISMTVDTSEWDKYYRKVEDGVPSLEYIMDNILKEELDNAVEEAKTIVPVDTGRLRDSIRREENSFIADAKNPNTGAGYAGWVEYGHHSYPGSPYIRPAIESAVLNIRERVTTEIFNVFAVRETWAGRGVVEVVRTAGRFVTWRKA